MDSDDEYFLPNQRLYYRTLYAEEMIKEAVPELDLNEPMRLSLIGKGSIGNVYLAKNEDDEPLVVVRKIDLNQPRDNAACLNEKQVKAVRKEMDVLKRLRHRNIVRYLGVFKSTDTLKITQQYVPT